MAQNDKSNETILAELLAKGFFPKHIAEHLGIKANSFYRYSWYFQGREKPKSGRTPSSEIIKKIRSFAKSKGITMRWKDFNAVKVLYRVYFQNESRKWSFPGMVSIMRAGKIDKEYVESKLYESFKDVLSNYKKVWFKILKIKRQKTRELQYEKYYKD